MTPIPGEPHDRKPQELRDKHGRKVTLVIPGLTPARPEKTEERGSAEPPRDDPRPPVVNPHHAGF